MLFYFHTLKLTYIYQDQLMKQTLLLFILLSTLFSAHAADTLTVRQIYDFEVGDTFVYSIQDFTALHQSGSV